MPKAFLEVLPVPELEPNQTATSIGSETESCSPKKNAKTSQKPLKKEMSYQ